MVSGAGPALARTCRPALPPEAAAPVPFTKDSGLKRREDELLPSASSRDAVALDAWLRVANDVENMDGDCGGVVAPSRVVDVQCDESKFFPNAPTCAGPPVPPAAPMADVAVVAVVVAVAAVADVAAVVTFAATAADDDDRTEGCAFSARVLYLRDLIGEPIGLSPGDVDGELSSSSISSACAVPGTALDFLAGVGRPVRFRFGDSRTSLTPPVAAIITLAAIDLRY